MKHNSRGMTLVEVLVALAIFTIVLSITFGIYISSTKSISKTEVKTMLQSEAQMIQYKLTPLAMESKGVNSIELDNLENGNTDNDFIKISSISFEGIDTNNYIFEVNDKELNLLVDDKIYNLSSNIDEFSIKVEESELNDKSIEDIIKESKSIEINIVLNKKRGFSDITYPISTIINFRNKR